MEKKWEIIRYVPSMHRDWDDFVRDSRQGTMLHMRGYMDYHSDRFADCSLTAWRDDKLAAILPANITADGILCSHQGLTYGGWLTPMRHFNANDMLELFDAWLQWCKSHSISSVIYKPVPSIYHKIPADEDLYALFRYGAELKGMNLSTAVDLCGHLEFNTLQRRHLRKSSEMNPWIRETSDAAEFMALVSSCLMERHGATPVHSPEEMQMLKDRFPDAIRMWLCGVGDVPEAGVCVYDCSDVAHCQYIATSPAGRDHGTLTFLMHRLMTGVYASRRWFDMGTSNENGGRVLNAGLIRQKTSLGGSGVAYRIYSLRL